MNPAGFEPAIPASEEAADRRIDCAVTGIGHFLLLLRLMSGLSIPIHFHEAALKKHRVNLFLTMTGLCKKKKKQLSEYDTFIRKQLTSYISVPLGKDKTQNTQQEASHSSRQYLGKYPLKFVMELLWKRRSTPRSGLDPSHNQSLQ